MMVEIVEGKMISTEEAKLIYNRVQHWNPEGDIK
jgi:hypothetical protein